MSDGVVFLLVGVVCVAFAIAMTAATVRDVVRLRRDLKSDKMSASAKPAAVERWVMSSTGRLYLNGYVLVGGMTIALLFVHDGLRGIWLPPVLLALMWLIRPLTTRQQRQYAKVFFS